MNNWKGLIGRSRQIGLVLPVALLLLVILTVAAVASMRGTAMQERMAVGQIQMHSSFLDSEQLVWDAAACIRAKYIDEDDNFITSPPEPNVVIQDCGETDLEDGAVITHSIDPWVYTVIAARTFADTGAVRPVVLEVITPGGGGPPLPNLAPYACFGPNCDLSRAQSAASPTADGVNRLSPDIGERCRIQGRHRPAVDPEGGIVPGVIIPDGNLIGNWTRQGAAEGDPPYINDPDEWAEWNDPDTNPDGHIGDPKEYIDDIADAYTAKAEQPSGPLADGDAGVWVVGPGETLTIEGGNSTVFGVIILNGGRLEMIGNQCFVGSVLFRGGGQMVAASGTPATVGSVIGYAEEGGVVVNPSLNGNPSFYYSDRALEIAQLISGADLFEIARWRAPIELDLNAFGL